MKSLTVKYIDEHAGFKHTHNAIYNALNKYFRVQVVKDNPDIVISLGFGTEHFHHHQPKIILMTEVGRFNPDYFDLCTGFRIHDAKNFNPNFKDDTYFDMLGITLYDGYDDLLHHNKRHAIYTPNPDKFCAFMYHNGAAIARRIFCKKLMKYKRVDCLGAVMRNTEAVVPKAISNNHNWRQEQLHIYNRYKFTIAFENQSVPRYVTEKMLQPLLVGAIPIYWGAEDANEYFNPDCFINVNDFKSFEDCIAHIKKVDNDPELYQKYLDAPPILPTSKLHDMTVDKLGDWLYGRIQYVLDNPKTCVGAIPKQQQKSFKKRQKNISRKQAIKQITLYNVPMPLWEKIYYMAIYSLVGLVRKVLKLLRKFALGFCR